MPALNEPTYGRVRDRIREEILAGNLKPGERLRTTQLAERYRVSAMPIREALQSLQGEGLVELIPNRGASVRKLDRRSVLNMYDIRGAIESMLCRRSAQLVRDSDIEELVALQEEYERSVEIGNYGDAFEANRRFHHIINSLPQNEDAVRIIEQHWGLIQALRRRYSFGAGRLDDIICEHRRLIEALRARDAGQAAQIALEHCHGAKEDLLKLMEGSGWDG